MGFLLHCGSAAATLDEVREVPTPPSTDTWYPVSHGTVVDAIKTGLLEHSPFKIVSEEYGLWNEGSRLFGFLGIENGQSHDDYQLNIGFRSSLDKSFSIAYALGNRVFVCDNCILSGEVVFSRKHTRHAERDLFRVVAEAFGSLGSLKDSLENRIEAYKRTELSNTQVHDLLIKSVDARVIPNGRITKVLREWRASDHEEFKARTAWTLHNAYTESFKGSNPHDLSRRSVRLHGLLDSVATESGNDPQQIEVHLN